MKVLLLEDVFKLGRAGDVKKVADGYGRNYLLPQGLAMLATEGALKRTDHIKKVAGERRAVLNKELGAVAERIEGIELTFPVKAGETGRLYGSVTPGMIADAIMAATGVEIDRKQVDTQPLKVLGIHTAQVRLTMDLVPDISIIVYREGESPDSVMEAEVDVEDDEVEDFAELQAELEAQDVEAAMQEDVDAQEEGLEELGESEVEAVGEAVTAEMDEAEIPIDDDDQPSQEGASEEE